MARRVLPFFVLLALLAASCDGKTVYSVARTRACFVARSAAIGGKLDFVATTATGGAFKATLNDNSVKLVFGLTEADAQAIVDAYERFAYTNVRANLADVLRRYNNVVALWHKHPQDMDLAILVGCLR